MITYGIAVITYWTTLITYGIAVITYWIAMIVFNILSALQLATCKAIHAKQTISRLRPLPENQDSGW